MKDKPESMRDVFVHASSFILHDIGEITRLQGSEFSDVDKFSISAYKKAFVETRTWLRKLFRYVNVLSFDEIFFKNFDKTNKLPLEQYLGQNKKTITDISFEMGNVDFKNIKEMSIVTVNPISNMQAFKRGLINFTSDIFVHDKSLAGIKTINVYSYNCITNELLTWKEDGMYLNEFRLQTKNLSSLNLASWCVVSYGIANIAKMPKCALQAEYLNINDDFSTAMHYLFTSRAHFVVHCNLEKNDLYWLEILLKAGYVIAEIDKLNNITPLENLENIDLSKTFIIGNKANLGLIKN